jgi:hypothetical protein
MVSIENGKTPLSWSQYQEKLAQGQMKPMEPHP